MFKKGCPFREKFNICRMSIEQCHPYLNEEDEKNRCSLYDLIFDQKVIKKKLRKITQNIVDINKQMKKLRKEGKKKSDEYKELKSEMKDRAYGMTYLSKAYAYLKRTEGGRLS